MTSQEPDGRLLKKAEVEAEALVSVLRILVALGLLAVFFAAVGQPPETLPDYLARQWIFAVISMLAYLGLGVLTLALARFGRFRSWMVWPVATADCLFMLLNTHAGLMNTEAPGSVTFMLPPTWLVPVIFGFLVLRFNPYLLAYATALMVLGLGALLLSRPPEVAVDIVARAESLIAQPPNLVRLAMIALAGMVLVVAAARMRRLLHRSLIEAEARLSLTRYLPARLAGRLETEGVASLREGRRQDMAVMFVDIRGFTAWSEGRDPSEVGAFVTAFRICVQEAAEAHGGLVDKFIGDAAMLLFEGAGAAPRALGCAQDLSERVQDLSLSRGETVRIGMGLHWGEVFSGVVGSDARLEYTALGDTVNIAARLEQLTKDAGLETIVSKALLEAAAGDRGPARDGWIPLEPMLLRGRSTPIALFGRGPSA